METIITGDVDLEITLEKQSQAHRIIAGLDAVQYRVSYERAGATYRVRTNATREQLVEVTPPWARFGAVIQYVEKLATSVDEAPGAQARGYALEELGCTSRYLAYEEDARDPIAWAEHAGAAYGRFRRWWERGEAADAGRANEVSL